MPSTKIIFQDINPGFQGDHTKWPLNLYDCTPDTVHSVLISQKIVLISFQDSFIFSVQEWDNLSTSSILAENDPLRWLLEPRAAEHFFYFIHKLINRRIMQRRGLQTIQTIYLVQIFIKYFPKRKGYLYCTLTKRSITQRLCHLT